MTLYVKAGGDNKKDLTKYEHAHKQSLAIEIA